MLNGRACRAAHSAVFLSLSNVLPENSPAGKRAMANSQCIYLLVIINVKQKKQKPTFSLLLFSSLSVNKISIQSLSLNCQTQSWETNQKVQQLLQHPMQKIEMKWMYFSKDKHAHCFQAFLCLRLFHTQP